MSKKMKKCPACGYTADNVFICPECSDVGMEEILPYHYGPQFEHGGDMIRVSTPHVMKSNAGHYVGAICETVDGEMKGLIEPFERFTPYLTQEDAEKYVADWKKTDPEIFNCIRVMQDTHGYYVGDNTTHISHGYMSEKLAEFYLSSLTSDEDTADESNVHSGRA